MSDTEVVQQDAQAQPEGMLGMLRVSQGNSFCVFL